MMKYYLLLFLLTSILFNNCNNKRSSVDQPNVVIIFMDDMGYGDVVANGAIDYQTPNIDKLAAQGMRFTNFYAVQPNCTPSRAGLLTGTYPNRIGLDQILLPHSKLGLNPKEETIADMLKKEGYATGMVGKWHLGDARKFLPLQQGFDMYFGLPYSNDMWPRDYQGQLKSQSHRPPLPLVKGTKAIQYIRNLDQMSTLTTRYTQRAIHFINAHKQQPFFLYFAHTMPHTPLTVSDKFKGSSKQGPYGDVMREIDWSVGQVMKTLKKEGLEDNTLVIFTSDNGPWLNFGDYAGSTGGLRGGKTNTWEGGVRAPTIMRWPEVIPAGTVNNKLACTIDLLPTLAAITGAALPTRKIDGVNILSLLKGDKNSNPRDHLYYYFNRNALQGVRQGHWKLVLPHDYVSYEGELPGQGGNPGERGRSTTGLALFDLRRDPGERHDVKARHPEVTKEIMKLAEQARQDLGDSNINRPCSNCRPSGKLTEEGDFPSLNSEEKATN